MMMPQPAAVLQLLKPITWFPPMWAYMCGIVSTGLPITDRWVQFVAGVLLAGPMVCGTSQAVNDWFDRHVDAINEPDRPIPSGRIPGRWGLYIAVLWTLASVAVSLLLGLWGVVAAIVGLALAWMYSAPPFRFKRNGWIGATATGFAYEGLPWFTGAVVMAAVFPDPKIITVLVLYSIGAHGIMTLNDFKAVEGDRETGLASLPVTLGVDRAVAVANWTMAVPQMVVIALLIHWDRPLFASAVLVSLGLQAICMFELAQRPKELAPWYNATGVTLYVLGMLVTAFALRPIVFVEMA
ncbi:chlorophyll synthase [Rhodothalassium salexigens DSM 2132]|uniref:Chlorophyll synthase n=1 Tax=Rhodothalassium salexigens DSM 2132 TaxID=1188247 RepID=A0A4R2PIJ5_RHOSA|nr:chlorophyll synthase ChlG [Rhodothalassium salexigens]MBB4211391.1 chlorophyll synthase [Rhodothalassium salexigens DSM 2132]MBK1637724.1 bacteriochlorophyll/chlorophyll a synthase [Rhodothalassium salexigens DSM 2132]TCP35312.1 chlorophyll synthase [Rhodothalassium salexigens DSM 2132]